MRRRIPKQSRGKSTDLRPTTSRVLSALFSMFGPEGVNGLKVLDLYAGTGSFGLRALERGAAQVVMVEFNRQRCDALRQAVQQHGYQDFEHQFVLEQNATLEIPVELVAGTSSIPSNPAKNSRLFSKSATTSVA